MQWLIDLIIESIGVPPCYIDRGDEAIDDFRAIDFTRDGFWHTLDLSGIIPTNATAVSLTVLIASGIINDIATFAPRITSGLGNFNTIVSQVANLSINKDLTISIGPNRTIAYKIPPGVWQVVNLSVKGWWL